MSEGRCLGHLRLGNGPNGQALPHCGTCSSLRGAFDVLPVAELLVVDAVTFACPKQPST